MNPELHFEILPPDQKQAWQIISQHSDKLNQSDFYLAGGTALALQLGHRQSVDFDFFSQTTDITQHLEWLQNLDNFTLRETDAKTIHGDISKVKISLIGGYKFPLINDTIYSAEQIHLANILDIGAMKLLAITHRATIRDYIDIAIILRDHLSLDEIVTTAESKHGPKFNRLIPLRALVSFSDITGELPKMFDENITSEWQNIIKQAVSDIA